ncbi:MAG: ParB/RepB/Spo0J family partition protein [Steroidobacteraceae bacterium]|jgi:ParB family chromosome partitioning protein|nr:ParB/RepB/Spo0J family partition protein [Steroidobacteraceae bacterium]
MSTKKPALGRGLGALLGEATARQVTANAAALAAKNAAPEPPAAPTSGQAAAASPAPVPPGEELARLPVDLLQRGKYQPRVDMRPESLQELADSIRAQGVVQPIVVRPLGTPGPVESQRYEIIAGERRWRAAQMAGLAEIPAVIRRVPDEAAVAMALIENIQRENLNPLEEARAIERLVDEFALTHQEAAEAVGRSRAAVSNLLRLLELADEVKTLVEKRELEMGHARALLGLQNRRQQAEVGALVAKKGLSVRETEALVRRLTAGNPEAGDDGARRADANIRQLQTELSEKLGAKVTFRHQPSGRGQLVVSYSSLDELDGILSHIR